MVYLRTYLDTTFKQPTGEMVPVWGGHYDDRVMLIPHTTFFRNLDKNVMPWEKAVLKWHNEQRLDVPDMNIAHLPYETIILHEPLKFDVSVKDPKRMWLRPYL